MIWNVRESDITRAKAVNEMPQDQRLNYFLQYDNQITPDGNLLVRAYRSEHENKMQFSPTATVTSEEDAERWLNQVEGKVYRSNHGKPPFWPLGRNFGRKAVKTALVRTMTWTTPVFLSRMNLKSSLICILQPVCAMTTTSEFGRPVFAQGISGLRHS